MIHWYPIIDVTAPFASNPNLYAQQGAFTLHRPALFFPEREVDRRSVEEILQEGINKEAEALQGINKGAESIKVGKVRADAMFHFSLPSQKADHLLWLLAKEGIGGNTLFPGYGGVVKGLRERQQWRSITDQDNAD
jgi:hypothetical protein